MKRTNTLTMTILLIVMLLGSFCSVGAQTKNEEYIPVHTSEELSQFFTKITGYLNENGQKLLSRINENESRIVNTALVRSWAVAVYENASPQQIDHAYDALYNMSLFLGLAADPEESFSSGMLFQYAVQLLDQEYYDLLAASGEDPENIEYAAYLRDISEALVEDPESFDAAEVEDWLLEIYQESYMASGLKTIAHTEALPEPEDLFPQNAENTMMPNPQVQYENTEPLDEMLGIHMPGMPEELGAKTGYYSIIAKVIAETKYDLPDGGIVVLRLSPLTDEDISGVYGAEFYEDREIASTMAEIARYQSMWIARGTVKTADEIPYSFAVDAENVTEEQFYKTVVFFIESCRNQKAGK